MRWLLLLSALCAGLACASLTAAGSPHHRRSHSVCHKRRHHRCRRSHHVKHIGAPLAVKAPAGAGAPAPTPPPSTAIPGAPVDPPPSTTTATTTSTGPAPPPPLPSYLGVDEFDGLTGSKPFSLQPTHNPVAAGTVTFTVENLGMDGHTFAIDDAASHQVLAPVAVASQTAVTVSAALTPGSYTLYCSLTGHAAAGMSASLSVQ
ncbi:MAG: hypothetical protein NVSMB51_14910 [Solirubrobacteraceae bacterium]